MKAGFAPELQKLGFAIAERSVARYPWLAPISKEKVAGWRR
jgi:hypothetical protein